jgi:PUB domain
MSSDANVTVQPTDEPRVQTSTKESAIGSGVMSEIPLTAPSSVMPAATSAPSHSPGLQQAPPLPAGVASTLPYRNAHYSYPSLQHVPPQPSYMHAPTYPLGFRGEPVTPQYPSYPYPSSTYQNYPAVHQDGMPYSTSTSVKESVEFTPAKAATLVAIGGMLGLTAAAAVRWLNGGDFVLFPITEPCSAQDTAGSTHDQEPADRTLTAAHQDCLTSPTRRAYQDEARNQTQDEFKYSAGEFDDDGAQLPSDFDEYYHDSPLEGQLSRLVAALHRQSSSQERLLQSILNENTLCRLRKGTVQSDPGESSQLGAESNQTQSLALGDQQQKLLIFAKLTEIQAELSDIRRALRAAPSSNAATVAASDSKGKSTLGTDHANWDSRLSATLDDVRSSLESLRSCMNADSLAEPTSTPVLQPVMSQQGPVAEPDEPQPSSEATSDSGTADAAVDIGIRRQALERALEQLGRSNEHSVMRAGVQLLYLYVVNLAGNAQIPRYRKIFTSNESFKRVDRLVGGRDLLTAVGFESRENCLEWLPDAVEGEAAKGGSVGVGKQSCLRQECLALLQDAAAALSILNSATKSSEPDGPEKLANQALNVLSWRVAVSDSQTFNETSPSSVDEGDQNAVNAPGDVLVSKAPSSALFWGSAGDGDAELTHTLGVGDSILSPPLPENQASALSDTKDVLNQPVLDNSGDDSNSQARADQISDSSSLLTEFATSETATDAVWK